MTVEICSRITDVISLCGGGIPAVFYATGILYALHKSGKLLKTIDGVSVLNPSLLITASSGGTIPLLILHSILNNNLQNSRDDWFEHYIIKYIDMIQPISMAQLYIASIFKSICVYMGVSSEIVRICNDTIKKIITDVMPPEITSGKPLVFTSDACCPIRYNYVIDSPFNDSPLVSNDFSHLNGINLITQVSEVITACCIAISFSHLKPGTINDAALLVDNDILLLDSYVNLKNIYYYSLTAYDAKTNNSFREPNIFSISNYSDRSSRIYNYRAINNLKLYAANKTENGNPLNFNLITFPNKYDPVCKYNNKIYRDLVPNIFYQNDFPEILTFLGVFNGDTRMLQLMFLIGAFETMSINGMSDEIASKIADTLPEVYKQTLADPYNVYYKQDPLSVVGRLLFKKV
jgi:hypothetical protein